MRRKRVLLLALGIAVAIIVVLVLLTPAPPVAAPPAPPPVVASRKPPLQADVEGSYVPGYRFTVNRFQFTGFTLHPDALVTFAPPVGTEQPVPCLEARISATTIHLRCEDPQLGTVTIDGRFLTRFATKPLDAGVVSAVVTVRSGSGEVLYRAQDTFQWHPGDEGGATP